MSNGVNRGVLQGRLQKTLTVFEADFWSCVDALPPIGRHAGPEVLGLYRKRPSVKRQHDFDVWGRFRYSDLKEAAGTGDAMGFE
jgi:hypothetical protein